MFDAVVASIMDNDPLGEEVDQLMQDIGTSAEALPAFQAKQATPRKKIEQEVPKGNKVPLTSVKGQDSWRRCEEP